MKILKSISISNKLSLISVLILASFSAVYAQLENTQTITKTGTTAATFLKIGADARGSAMGNAFTAMRGDISAVYWNPAGLAKIHGFNMLVVNNDWLAGIDLNYSSIAINTGRFSVIGLSITSLSVPRDQVRTVEQPEGTGEYWEANSIAIYLSYAKNLTDRFALGGNIKMVQENIWHSGASTYAVDLGALFVTPFRGIRFGVSISNYGGGMRLAGRDLHITVDPDPDNQGNVEFVDSDYETDEFPLPLLLRVGISGEILNSNKLRVSYGLDALHPNDNTESVNTGFEIALAETFFLRGGYANLFRENSEEGLTFGGGIHYRLWGTSTILKIDYSFTDFGRLEGVQRISIGVKL